MTVTRKGFRKCVRCGNNRRLSRYRGTRGRICDTCRKRGTQHASRAVRVFETHSITLGEYDEILEAQGGGCAICGGLRPVFDIDHDHALERALIAQGMSAALAHRASIRGLLCRQHNRRLLPAAKDSVEILGRAIHYLTSPPAFGILGSVKPALDSGGEI